jgi:hypothetical protein
VGLDQEVSAVLPASEDAVPGQAGRLFSRAAALRALLAGGAAAGLAGISSAEAAPSEAQDRKILNYLLVLEQLQAAFYAEARRRGALSGGLASYVDLVGRHEQAHVVALSQLLGAAARPAPAFHFAAGVTRGDSFVRTAVELEETTVGAYIATGANLSAPLMADVGSICAVEGRHAAWIRSLANDLPAPAAADPAAAERRVLAVVRRFTR